MPLTPIVIMPARDEASLLEASCASLGFGRSARTPGCRLVVVDNGSSDATAAVALAIAGRSPPSAMEVVHEREPGHVPARHAGATTAARWAFRLGVAPADVLLLQADADTLYGPGYVEAMVRAAERAGEGRLVEGLSVPPAGADDATAQFRALEGEADLRLEGLLDFEDPFDVVVDDKVAGMRLSDYLAWGGHRREYDPAGEEVLAETTRLFMGAFASGARRTRVEDAEATTSQRRILDDPALAFATAGFPRPRAWGERWHGAYDGPRDLAAFRPGAQGILGRAGATRAAHVLALFGVLPAHVRSVVAQDAADPGIYGPALRRLGLDGKRMPPGEALSRALSIDPDEFLRG